MHCDDLPHGSNFGFCLQEARNADKAAAEEKEEAEEEVRKLGEGQPS